MNKDFPRRMLAAAVLAVMALAGCATTPPPPPPGPSFVDQEMANTIESIEQSLGVLVDLERGDEGPRKANALGMTVAGAAGPGLAPVPMPSTAAAATPLGQARIEAARARTRADLATRVRLTWTGSAEELLRDLSTRVGLDFAIRGTRPAAPPLVHLDKEEATIEQVLRTVAAQIDKSADIRVDTAARRVTLDYK